jgi:RNA polymerase sigma factor (TIGR02999 family)
MADGAKGDVTQLLDQWARGDRSALDSVSSLVYSELRKIADGYLRRERSAQTLQPTVLVHEAWIRLVRQDSPNFANRHKFFALAAQIMRQILVDHARSVKAEKRGGGAPKATLSELAGVAPDRAEEFLALDSALTKLGQHSERKAQIIELRYFGGLGVEEVAEHLGISIATVSRDQRMAEAWLSRTMAGQPA